MRLLLDTHIFLWIFAGDDRLTKKARTFLEDTETNEFFLSDVSVWEASIKFGSGKLQLPEKPESFFPDRVRLAEYNHLRIDLNHVTRVHSLPNIHGDPFDRLLISQAMIEELTILTNDPHIGRYKINTLTTRDLS